MTFYQVEVFVVLMLVNSVAVHGSLDTCGAGAHGSIDDCSEIDWHHVRRIPAVAYLPPESHNRRAIVSDSEFHTHVKRTKHERLTEEERHIERRKVLDPLQVCANARCYIPGVQASIVFGEDVNFCIDCLDPHIAGSHVGSWDMHYGPIDYHVDGLVRYAIPNNGKSKLINFRAIQNHIALIDRCQDVSIVQKVKRAQDAGAVAVIVADDGRCNEEFHCGTAGAKTQNPHIGFASGDIRSAWDAIHIPSVLVTKETGDRLKRAMQLEYVELPSIGYQYIPAD